MELKSSGRLEDSRLISGEGRYLDDLNLTGQVYGTFFRSPVAHAEIREVDVTAAKAMPGVVEVLTGHDLAAESLRHWAIAPLKNRDGSDIISPDRTALATGRVRFVGEPVALIVSETPMQGADAAEQIRFDFEELPAITETAYRTDPAIAIWPHAPDNLAFDFAFGDPEAVRTAFEDAAVTVSTKLVNQRLVVASMEPRGAIARFDDEHDRYEIWVGSQGAATLSRDISAAISLPPEKVRVRSGDVGGAFGMKTHVYPEHVALLFVARKVGRPVKWVSSRSEAFLSDTQGRDTTPEGELALDDEGNFLALRIRSTINLGAYPSTVAPSTATGNLRRCAVSVYRTQAVEIAAKCIYSNCAPTAPYRGAGRPETIMLIERLVELAAQKLQVDPVDLRKRNLISPELMPYSAPNGDVYDSGDFPRVLERAIALADYAGFPSRRAEAKARGRLRGIGIACYLEIAVNAATDAMALEIDADGFIQIYSGLQSNGQGHETIFPRIVADQLGLEIGQIALAKGDSLQMPGGFGTFGSRSLTVGGAAAIAAARSFIEAALDRGAQYLQADRNAVRYENGTIWVEGSERSATIREIARESGGFRVCEEITVAPNYPNGCQIAEIEIDPESGDVNIVSCIAVDDVGTVFDQGMVDGQVYGGIAQGLGQVFSEGAVYDPENGQLLTGSFMDYCLPRADDLPEFKSESVEVPCTTNPLGSKGAGEAGTTGALAAGYNALMDALRSCGVEGEFLLPASSSQLWHILNDKRMSTP